MSSKNDVRTIIPLYDSKSDDLKACVAHSEDGIDWTRIQCALGASKLHLESCQPAKRLVMSLKPMQEVPVPAFQR